MLEELTPSQLDGWMRYAELEPWGIDEGDFRAATLNGLVASVAGAKNVDAKDFMLRTFIERDRAAVASDDEATLDRLLGVGRGEVH